MCWYKAAMLARVFLKFLPRRLVLLITFHTSKRLCAIGKVYDLDGCSSAFVTQACTGRRVNI